MALFKRLRDTAKTWFNPTDCSGLISRIKRLEAKGMELKKIELTPPRNRRRL